MKKIIFIITAIALLAAAAAYAEQVQKPHHIEAGVACADCHGDDGKGVVTGDTCLGCHEKQEPKTDYLGEHDVHDSPHYGPDLECIMCHHEHKASELVCSECHDFKNVAP